MKGRNLLLKGKWELIGVIEMYILIEAVVIRLYTCVRIHQMYILSG